MMAQTGGVLYRSCWLLPNSAGGLGRDGVATASGYDCDEPELGGSGRRWWMCSFVADIPVRWEPFSTFEYSPQNHNVVQVSYDDYKKCNAASPMKTFTSGKDTIPIKLKGHLFYICGFSDNCKKGQKVGIRVVDALKA
ncbi:hypothetical protein C5167_041678 [Papaver somniferum]|nr:hypothetical protein C5167_041678 [Papaver somniferum]